MQSYIFYISFIKNVKENIKANRNKENIKTNRKKRTEKETESRELKIKVQKERSFCFSLQEIQVK